LKIIDLSGGPIVLNFIPDTNSDVIVVRDEYILWESILDADWVWLNLAVGVRVWVVFQSIGD
jgi:hypothetical protein